MNAHPHVSGGISVVMLSKGLSGPPWPAAQKAKRTARGNKSSDRFMRCNPIGIAFVPPVFRFIGPATGASKDETGSVKVW